MTANRKKAPEYLKDDHLSVGTKEYLKVLNSGDKPVESLSVPEARKVLVTAQASVKTDLSGITRLRPKPNFHKRSMKYMQRPVGWPSMGMKFM